MDLTTYISHFSLSEIIKIEESDLQFLHLKNSQENIKKHIETIFLIRICFCF